jgi:hypothetical protein
MVQHIIFASLESFMETSSAGGAFVWDESLLSLDRAESLTE